MKNFFIHAIICLGIFIDSQICYSQPALGSGVGNIFMSCSEFSPLYSCGGTNNGQHTNQVMVPDTVYRQNGYSLLTSIIDVDDEYSHVLALASNGTVWAWGEGNWGQLGDSTNISFRQFPWPVKGENGQGSLTNVKEISVGYYHSIFLMNDSTVMACGYNTNGQLGDNSTSHRNFLQKVHGVQNVGYLNDITAISAGSDFCLALRADSTIVEWGKNVLVPVTVPGLSHVVAISANGDINLVVKSDGTVWSWGYNTYGQLGTGNYLFYSLPVQVVGENGIGFLQNVIAVCAGDQHSFAITNNHDVYAWGYNFYGQLGDGTAMNRNTPVRVHGIGGAGFLSNVKSMKAGGQHTLASLVDGRVIAWGKNDSYDLGDSTQINRAYPILAHLPCSFAGISDLNETINTVDVFPNPFSEYINLKVNSLEPLTFVICDMTLRAVLQVSFSEMTNLTTTQLATGIYMYSVSGKNGILKNGLVIKN